MIECARTLLQLDLKKVDSINKEDDLKKLPSPQKIICPPPVKIYLNFFLMTSRSESHTQQMLNQNFYQVSKPEMEFHMINMIYTALSK